MKLISLSLPIDPTTGEPSAISFAVETDAIAQHVINVDHPRWDEARASVREFQEQKIKGEQLATLLLTLIDVSRKVAEQIVTVDHILQGRMTLEGRRIFIDGDAVDPSLESHVLRMLQTKDEHQWASFARFVEKLYSNVDEHVRLQFFGWLSYETTKGHGFTLTDDGDVIGYKGLAGTAENPVSLHSGTAVVNNVRHQGQIPNPVGAVVSMPRSQVQADPAVGCSTGLHVGTYAYAKNISRGIVAKVVFSPAAVVSVPTECEAQKIRVDRYRVLEIVNDPDVHTRYRPPIELDENAVLGLLTKALKDKSAVILTHRDRRRITCALVKIGDGDVPYVYFVSNGALASIALFNIVNVEPVETEVTDGSLTIPSNDEVSKHVELITRAKNSGAMVTFVYRDAIRRPDCIEDIVVVGGDGIVVTVENGLRRSFYLTRMAEVQLVDAAESCSNEELKEPNGNDERLQVTEDETVWREVTDQIRRGEVNDVLDAALTKVADIVESADVALRWLYRGKK